MIFWVEKLPSWLIKEAIGLPLPECNRSSFEEIKRNYIDADKNSEEERAYFNNFSILLKKKLELGNLEIAKEIYEISIELEMDEIKELALSRWNDLSSEEVAMAKTYSGLDLAYDRSHKNSQARREVVSKKIQWATREFFEANTLIRLQKACSHAPENSEIQKRIIKEIYQRYFEHGDGLASE